MQEFDLRLDEYAEHGNTCPVCSERQRKLDELASEAIVAIVTDVLLDDIPSAERPLKYVYMSKKELFN